MQKGYKPHLTTGQAVPSGTRLKLGPPGGIIATEKVKRVL